MTELQQMEAGIKRLLDKVELRDRQLAAALKTLEIIRHRAKAGAMGDIFGLADNALAEYENGASKQPS